MNIKSSNLVHKNPIVVGGVGGSGTRLIAECLKNIGVYIGSDLNEAFDNLWFTLLFKRSEILSISSTEFEELAEIMQIAMTRKNALNDRHLQIITDLTSKDRPQHLSPWLVERARSILSNSPEIQLDHGWGWKEPNSHIVLDQLMVNFENMKYIHVARNGLDMAYSSNQNQLRLWGAHFLQEPVTISPYYSLKYWCAVHKRVLSLGQLMQKNFLFLNYDEFCLNPRKGLLELVDFLELDSTFNMKQLLELVHPPTSVGRFKQAGIEIFSASDVAYVESLGFDINL